MLEFLEGRHTSWSPTLIEIWVVRVGGGLSYRRRLELLQLRVCVEDGLASVLYAIPLGVLVLVLHRAEGSKAFTSLIDLFGGWNAVC